MEPGDSFEHLIEVAHRSMAPDRRRRLLHCVEGCDWSGRCALCATVLPAPIDTGSALCRQETPRRRISHSPWCILCIGQIDWSRRPTLQRHHAPAVEVDRFPDSCYDPCYLGRGCALIRMVGFRIRGQEVPPGVTWKRAPMPSFSSRDGLSACFPTTTTKEASRGPTQGRS
jgi:hypothetical protein